MPDLPPLRGLLAEETEDCVRIDAANGRWTVQRDDVVALRSPGATSEAPGQGDEVEIVVRHGAVVEVSQTLRLEVTDRPMTIPDERPRITGSEKLREAAAAWAALFASTDVCVEEQGTYSWMDTFDAEGDHVDGVAVDSLD